jgi:hypothetical protein
MKKQNKRNINGNKKKLAAKIKNQNQSNKQIEVRIAQTLDEAIANAERNGRETIVFEGILYLKPQGDWIGLDFAQRLLDFPAYQEVYNTALLQSNDTKIVKDVILAVWLSNQNTNTKYDIDMDILLEGFMFQATK